MEKLIIDELKDGTVPDVILDSKDIILIWRDKSDIYVEHTGMLDSEALGLMAYAQALLIKDI